ncbi:MAG: hypothetical protein OXR73_31945 [Myxococcales bacterium]|nr:hypothetical protein [Myxococcales bacterium]
MMRAVGTIVIGLCLLPGCDLILGCEEGGRDFSDGEVWTCSDGCNSCSCSGGEVVSTAAHCGGPPGPAAGKLICQYTTGSFRHGRIWDCPEFDRCLCVDGRIVRDPGGADAGT